MLLKAELAWLARAEQVRGPLRDAWSQLQTDDGLLLSKSFLALLLLMKYTSASGRAHKRANEKPTDLDADLALQAMGLSPYHVHDGVFLRFSTVEKWFLQETLGERGDLRNVLLTRTPIGLPRRGYHMMPPSGTAFGADTRKNPETVWDLVHNKYSNREEQGPDAMQRRDFPADAAHARVSRYRPASAFSADARFGNPSASRTPIADIVNNKFAIEGQPGMELAPDRAYAPNEGKVVSGNRVPKPRPTRASSALAETNRLKLSHLAVVGRAALPASSRPHSARA